MNKKIPGMEETIDEAIDESMPTLVDTVVDEIEVDLEREVESVLATIQLRKVEEYKREIIYRIYKTLSADSRIDIIGGLLESIGREDLWDKIEGELKND